MSAAWWVLLGMLLGRLASYLDRRWRKWLRIGEYEPKSALEKYNDGDAMTQEEYEEARNELRKVELP